MSKRGYNLNFFKKETKELAYVLGFWFADGCMSKGKGQYKYHRIGFFSSECNLLKEITHHIGCSTHISPEGKDGCSSLTLAGENLYNTFMSLGGIENKSRKSIIPKICYAFPAEFIRGFFEGDGSVNLYKNNYIDSEGSKIARITISCGSFDFIWDIQDILYENFKIKSTLIKRFHRIKGNKISWNYALTIYSRQAVKFYKQIYKSEPKYYKRKYNLLKKASEHIERDDWSEKEIEYLIKIFDKIPFLEVVKQFRFRKGRVKRKAWELNLQDYNSNTEKYGIVVCEICGSLRRVNKANLKRVKKCKHCQLKINDMGNAKHRQKFTKENNKKLLPKEQQKVSFYCVSIRTLDRDIHLQKEKMRELSPIDLKDRLKVRKEQMNVNRT